MLRGSSPRSLRQRCVRLKPAIPGVEQMCGDREGDTPRAVVHALIGIQCRLPFLEIYRHGGARLPGDIRASDDTPLAGTSWTRSATTSRRTIGARSKLSWPPRCRRSPPRRLPCMRRRRRTSRSPGRTPSRPRASSRNRPWSQWRRPWNLPGAKGVDHAGRIPWSRIPEFPGQAGRHGRKPEFVRRRNRPWICMSTT